MSINFTINDIRNYLLMFSGTVEYHELVKHFKHCLSDPQTQHEARIAFKDYVNDLASVQLLNGKKYIVLRPQYLNDNVRNEHSMPSSVEYGDPNSIGLPVAEKRRSNSLNDSNSMFQSDGLMLSAHKWHDSHQSIPNVLYSHQYDNDQDIPPQPPPRRRTNNGSPKVKLEEKLKHFHVERDEKENQNTSPPHQQEKLKEIHELSQTTPGRVKEHALKINKMASQTELGLKPPMPLIASQASINRIKARSSVKDEDTDSGSLQPLDPLRRRWILAASNCDYNELVLLLKEEPKLCGFKDFTSGYTSLHWAAKFGKPDVIKLIAGTYGVNPNIKSHGGFTPLHLAAIHCHESIMELLIKTYNADQNIRDYSGKRATQYLPKNTNNSNGISNNSSLSRKQKNGLISTQPHIFGPSSIHKPIQVRTSESTSSFIRIGSLKAANKMKKITGISLKTWGSVESISENNSVASNQLKKSKKTKKSLSWYSTPEHSTQSNHKDSDSDSMYGFQ